MMHCPNCSSSNLRDEPMVKSVGGNGIYCLDCNRVFLPQQAKAAPASPVRLDVKPTAIPKPSKNSAPSFTVTPEVMTALKQQQRGTGAWLGARPTDKPHCPRCGSTKLADAQHHLSTEIDGKKVGGLLCGHCGEVFLAREPNAPQMQPQAIPHTAQSQPVSAAPINPGAHEIKQDRPPPLAEEKYSGPTHKRQTIERGDPGKF